MTAHARAFRQNCRVYDKKHRVRQDVKNFYSFEFYNQHYNYKPHICNFKTNISVEVTFRLETRYKTAVC